VISKDVDGGPPPAMTITTNPSSRIRRPKAVFLATGARYQFDIPRRYFAAQPKTAVVKTYPIPMP
jgi:hypothetical protein